MMYSKSFSRNAGVFSPEEQEKIKDSVFGIIGLGGVGGFVFENLVRMGAENFILFDGDNFEPTNLNRQLLSDLSAMGVPKIDIAEARAKVINKKVNIKKYRIFGSSSFEKIEKCSIVIDGSDNIETRLEVSKACRKLKIPYVFCSAGGSGGAVGIFIDKNFEDVFQIKNERLKEYPKDLSVICPSAAISGSLGASQAVNCLTGKEFSKAPEILFFDLSKKKVIWKKRLE